MWLGMKQDMKEVDNIIQTGPECTPGPEVLGAKRTDVATLPDEPCQTLKRGWPEPERVREQLTACSEDQSMLLISSA